jgi:hypothetical protein
VLVLLAVVLVLGAAAGVIAGLSSPGTSRCQQVFVPAYFYADSIWSRAINTKPAPSAMILDISGVGAGSSPEPHFKSVVLQAQHAGVAILGYTSTDNGLRPVAAVEADVRNYKAWYGVTDIFLDEVHAVGSELPYYTKLASYIHRVNPGSSVWLNPGVYPNRRYMSVGNVVMVFENTYSQYSSVRVPRWARHYRADRFANTIYATPGSQLATAIRLSRSRDVGNVYVTNLAGPPQNPYDELPSYWMHENTALATGCSAVQS